MTIVSNTVFYIEICWQILSILTIHTCTHTHIKNYLYKLCEVMAVLIILNWYIPIILLQTSNIYNYICQLLINEAGKKFKDNLSTKRHRTDIFPKQKFSNSFVSYSQKQRKKANLIFLPEENGTKFGANARSLG